MSKEKELNQPSTMLFSKQTPAAGGTAFAQFDAAWCYDGNGYILNETGTSLDVRIGATGSVITLAAGGTLPIKLVYSMAELYVRRTDQSTTQVTVEAQVGTGSAGGGGSTADMGVIAAAATAAHNASAGAHPRPSAFEICVPWISAAVRDAAGTGSITVLANGGYVQVKTGTTAGSKSAACVGDAFQYMLTIGTSVSTQSGDGNFIVRFLVSTDGAASDGVARLVFGRKASDATGNLDAAGFAVEIRNRRLWLVAWDGSLKSVDLGVDLITTASRLVVIKRTSTGFSAWVDGVACPSLACGAIGALQTFSVPRAETENRTSAAEHRLNFSAIRWEAWL